MLSLERLKPRQIFSPYGIDPHPDHVAVAAAIEELVQRGTIQYRVFEYPRFQAQSALLHLANPVLWRRFRRIQAEDRLPLKRAALAEHRSQCENFTNEEGWQVLPPHWTKMFFKRYELFVERNHAKIARK
jgi:LmbE family N-acetylglucosaminyl deacetylase